MRLNKRKLDSLVKGVVVVLGLSLLGPKGSVAQTTISVAVSPQAMGATVGQALSLTATVTDDPLNNGVIWSAIAGSFSQSATASGAATNYTAAATAGVYLVTATSVTDPTKNASITI